MLSVSETVELDRLTTWAPFLSVARDLAYFARTAELEDFIWTQLKDPSSTKVETFVQVRNLISQVWDTKLEKESLRRYLLVSKVALRLRSLIDPSTGLGRAIALTDTIAKATVDMMEYSIFVQRKAKSGKQRLEWLKWGRETFYEMLLIECRKKSLEIRIGS